MQQMLTTEKVCKVVTEEHETMMDLLSVSSDESTPKLRALLPKVLTRGDFWEEVVPTKLARRDNGHRSFYLMERIQGKTLRAHLILTYPSKQLPKEERSKEKSKQENKQLPMFDIRNAMTSLIKTLAKAENFKHGDLKPENLIVENAGGRNATIRLIDPCSERPYYAASGCYMNDISDAACLCGVIIELALGKRLHGTHRFVKTMRKQMRKRALEKLRASKNVYVETIIRKFDETQGRITMKELLAIMISIKEPLNMCF